MVNRLLRTAFLTGFLLAFFTVANAQLRKSAILPIPSVDTVISWLPADTETVIVADVRNRSFLTAKHLKGKDDDEDEKNLVLPISEIAALFELQPLQFVGLKKPLARLIETHRV